MGKLVLGWIGVCNGELCAWYGRLGS